MKTSSIFAVRCAVSLLAVLSVFAAGCAHWPATPRLDQVGGPGYRLADVTRPGQSDDLLVILAISGGGTRAAALGYGVLEELRRTEVMVNGVKRRLIDEVDVISAVSGGTLPATYYALRGEKTFEEFEEKVLSRNLESELAKRIILNPVNWFRLPSGTFGKSDLFAELYDETVFNHATFGDLQRANGPFVIINATDVTTGARFSYTQGFFDAICGDLARVTLGRAIATSTALPPLLTPITLENRGGTCGRKTPALQTAAEAANGESETPGRALLYARALQSYQDPARPFIHLFDGGLSENLGLTEVIMAFELLKGDPDQTVLPALRRARKVVVIVVNALRYPEVDWDRSPAPPDTGTLTDQMWSIPVDRISLDAVEQVREKLEAWQAAAPAGGPERRAYLAQVTFDSLKDPAERLYFKRVKTSLTLPKEQVDKLREVAGRLLREAPAFQRLLVDLNSKRSDLFSKWSVAAPEAPPK
ncbi:MAG TPA: patatin-like phospholipase family protein [Nitrospirota bacterium]|nr:patatin-like phospholipase family protein [Nitrospirota bacterium]